MLATLLVSCSSSPDDPGTGTGIFLTGCPGARSAGARLITDPAQRMEGPDALGGAGDVLLMSDKAAFIIQGVTAKTYWHYGGIVIDAVAVDGCKQAAPERFGELPLLVGRLLLSDFTSSTLRGFRAERIEIVNDGEDGKPAIVRVHGTDDYFWLVEYTLVKEAFQGGKRRPLSQPLGVELAVDYILQPGSSVLEIELHVTNKSADWLQVITGAAMFASDTTPVKNFSGSTLEIGGFSLRQNVPWLLATSETGAYAVAADTGNMGTINVAGVDAIIDVDQVVEPLTLAPAGGTSSTNYSRFLIGVGATDGNSAARTLQPYTQESRAHVLFPLQGTALDSAGAPVANATIEIRLKTKKDVWEPLDSFRTAADGSFSGHVADFFDDGDVEYRLYAHIDGRVDPEPQPFHATASRSFEVRFQAKGALPYRVRDAAGAALPAKLSIYRDGALVVHEYGLGDGEIALPPGHYEVSVTRGLEYNPVTGAVDVVVGTTPTFEATLSRPVDTTGWLSLDTHVHAGPSADSDVNVPRRIRTAAAAGLEVMVGTDHEVITDWKPHVIEAGVTDWLTTIVGEEVTASVPEHTIMFPVTVRADDGVRGRPVRWYELGIGEIYDASRARGAQVTQLNHPLGGCNYLCLIDWDGVAGAPRLTDPTALGLRASSSLWSWQFDTMEYMNDHQKVFFDPANPKTTGLFDDWISFHNHGHRVTAVGVTDTHSDPIGSPRTYFQASAEGPKTLDEADLVSAMKNGRVQVSAGAFARVAANGRGLGETVTDADGTFDLAVEIQALPDIDVSYFKVFVNCDEVLNIPARTPDAVIKHSETFPIPISKDGHVVVVGFGSKRFPRGLDQFDPTGVPRFTTNPIFIDVDGNGTFDPPGGKTCDYDLNSP